LLLKRANFFLEFVDTSLSDRFGKLGLLLCSLFGARPVPRAKKLAASFGQSLAFRLGLFDKFIEVDLCSATLSREVTSHSTPCFLRGPRSRTPRLTWRL